MQKYYLPLFVVLSVLLLVFLCQEQAIPAEAEYWKSKHSAERMADTSENTLKPVYAPLAEWLVTHFDLAENEGVGIDLGSGPGELILELCLRTKAMHWINADINPYFFADFYENAEKMDVAHRISAIQADAQQLPFRDDYADIIVSRGSFQFWGDLRSAFAEVYRVLKPGGVAYIGRGFPENLSIETAQKIRAKQAQKSNFPKYDLEETEARLRKTMNELGLIDYQIHRPHRKSIETIHYGIWIEFCKN